MRAITSDMLTKTKPDFVDDERRAWRIQTLVPEATQGTVVEASSSDRRLGEVRAADAGGPRAGAVSHPPR